MTGRSRFAMVALAHGEIYVEQAEAVQSTKNCSYVVRKSKPHLCVTVHEQKKDMSTVILGVNELCQAGRN